MLPPCLWDHKTPSALVGWSLASAAGKAVTGTATNGYRFWSIPDKPPAGQAARHQAAQAAAAKAT